MEKIIDGVSLEPSCVGSLLLLRGSFKPPPPMLATQGSQRLEVKGWKSTAKGDQAVDPPSCRCWFSHSRCLVAPMMSPKKALPSSNDLLHLHCNSVQPPPVLATNLKPQFHYILNETVLTFLGGLFLKFFPFFSHN